LTRRASKKTTEYIASCGRDCQAVTSVITALVTELIKSSDAEKALKTLIDLQVACAQETIGARPLFAEIGQILSGLIRR